ncbi:hypothetical protein HUJ04_011043 [Dendroctonus ponderosae]|nr:hypothetical protein HUJ04_011043 [Dendroctonus ponderosae]
MYVVATPDNTSVIMCAVTTMSQISSTKQPHMQEIDLATLNIQQLGTLKQRVDQELEAFQDSLTSLKVAQQKFQSSNETLQNLDASVEGKDILVPLTGSVSFINKFDLFRIFHLPETISKEKRNLSLSKWKKFNTWDWKRASLGMLL